ncbi:hypothetical protein AMATHDRAFT_1808 [Amanita thiersii Skay4041]|uniref:Bromo domain-containing protein n=1 Tax=Amanita thiersii Skay4041 TaxID=703135 RepID=A0A2A9NWL9_9AGAR|nr:hypothetical protein AMATHDRAFT_1808 [Amanita thiersii Skay4041]
MNGQASRASQLLQPEPSLLSNIESLLLVQAVWELGGNAWNAIAKLLSKHPLLSRPKSFFTPQSCHDLYIKLVNDTQLQWSAPENLMLAQKFYQLRLGELRSLIVVEEARFKGILAEIEAIRSGKWDEMLELEISKSMPEIPPPLESVADQLFAGSNSSSITDTSPLFRIRDGPHEGSSKHAKVEQQTISTDTETKTVSDTDNDDPWRSQMDLDVHVTAEEYSPREATLSEHKSEKSAAEGTNEFIEQFTSGGDRTPSPRRVQRQEEEEEEEGTIRPEEEEAEQDIDTEGHHTPGVRLSSLPPATEAKDIGEAQIITDEQSPQVDQEDEGATPTEDGLQPPVRRSSRRHRPSVSSAPAIPNKGTRSRKPRRISVTADTLSGPTDPEHGINVETDIVVESTHADQEHAHSPRTSDGGYQRSEGDNSQYLNVYVNLIEPAKRKASVMEGPESPRDRKRPRDDSEPVEDEEPGPSYAINRGRRRGDKTEEQVALKRFQNVIGMLHSQISQHRNGNIFHNPIKISEASDYHDIVKRPIDLKTIKAKVKDGLIANSLEYQRDIFLMFANAMMYNVPGSDVHAMAEDMMLESEALINSFRQTEGLVRRF